MIIFKPFKRSRRNDYETVLDSSGTQVSFSDESRDGRAKYWTLPYQFLGNKVEYRVLQKVGPRLCEDDGK